jgi:DNA-directed RNA polymerase specialized sigma24 family protein
MENSPSFKHEWVLTKGAFDKLLACLADDPELAGEKYEELRRMLVKIFEWRGALFPEDCADETLNRVARRIDEGVEIRDIGGYAYGVARLVLLETTKAPDTRRVALDDFMATAPLVESTEEKIELACFEECLQQLPSDSREIIVQYYSEEKRAKINRRKELAARLGIPLNALRSRAQRTRDKLELCIIRCLRTNSKTDVR